MSEQHGRQGREARQPTPSQPASSSSSSLSFGQSQRADSSQPSRRRERGGNGRGGNGRVGNGREGNGRDGRVTAGGVATRGEQKLVIRRLPSTLSADAFHEALKLCPCVLRYVDFRPGSHKGYMGYGRAYVTLARGVDGSSAGVMKFKQWVESGGCAGVFGDVVVVGFAAYNRVVGDQSGRTNLNPNAKNELEGTLEGSAVFLEFVERFERERREQEEGAKGPVGERIEVGAGEVRRTALMEWTELMFDRKNRRSKKKGGGGGGKKGRGDGQQQQQRQQQQQGAHGDGKKKKKGKGKKKKGNDDGKGSAGKHDKPARVASSAVATAVTTADGRRVLKILPSPANNLNPNAASFS